MNSLIILIVLAKPIYVYIYIPNIFPYLPNISIIFVLTSIDLCIFSPRLGLIRFLAPFRLINAYGVFPPEALPQAMPWWNARVLWCFMAIEAPKMDSNWINWIHISGATLQGVICFTYFSWNLGFVLEPFRQVRSTVVFQGSDDGSLGSPKAVGGHPSVSSPMGMGGVYHQTLGRYVNLQTLEFFSGA